MKKILVPTDFSENAANAAEYAAQVAQAMQYKLIVVHVARPKTDVSAEEDKLNIICDALQDSYPTLICDERIVFGENVPEEIVSASELFGVEMIVMGTKGITNFERMLFGSNTAAVIEKARCTVLSVPRGSGFLKPTRILFATNFEHEDVSAALQIVKLAKPFHAHVVIAHVLTGDEVEEIEKAKLQLFTREIAVCSEYPQVSYRLCSENTVTMGLDVLIEGMRADVIAMRTHKRNLLEKIMNPSITQKFAEHSTIPLMAFHAS